MHGQNLAIGKCRYGLMLNEDGMVYDDGVTTRLGENHYHNDNNNWWCSKCS